MRLKRGRREEREGSEVFVAFSHLSESMNCHPVCVVCDVCVNRSDMNNGIYMYSILGLLVECVCVKCIYSPLLVETKIHICTKVTSQRSATHTHTVLITSYQSLPFIYVEFHYGHLCAITVLVYVFAQWPVHI